jgi:hypothetical protein
MEPVRADLVYAARADEAAPGRHASRDVEARFGDGARGVANDDVGVGEGGRRRRRLSGRTRQGRAQADLKSCQR